MPFFIPNPDESHPAPGFPSVTFLKNAIARPNISVGDFTYYADRNGADAFERNVLYHFESIGDKLIIGRFCSIAADVRFLMNGANHRLDWFSNFPFHLFAQDPQDIPGAKLQNKGDTVIGNDVWIGNRATFLPGVQVGDGAIIGANAVVTADVAPYAVVGGNPARVLRYRFDEETIATLRLIAWWNWSPGKIARHVAALCSLDLDALVHAQ